MMRFLRWKNVSRKGQPFTLSTYDILPEHRAGLHTHDFAEVFWISKGRGTHIFPDQVRVLEAGMVCLIRPEVVHTFHTNKDMRLVNLAFPMSTWRWLESCPRPGGRAGRWLSTPKPLQMKLSSPAKRQLDRMTAELYRANHDSLAFGKFIFSLFSLLDVRDDSAVPSEAPDWLRRALVGVREANRARDGVHALVHLAGRSPEHVSRETKRWLGRTPQEIVGDIKVENAARRLAFSDEPIINVAADAGFENLGYFYRVFRRRFGMPPKQYRESQRRERAAPGLV